MHKTPRADTPEWQCQVVVSPDVGGVARARAFAKKLNDAPLAIVDKRRSAHNISEVMNLIGDVKDKVAVLVDDMIDTAGIPQLFSWSWSEHLLVMSCPSHLQTQTMPLNALHCCFPRAQSRLCAAFWLCFAEPKFIHRRF